MGRAAPKRNAASPKPPARKSRSARLGKSRAGDSYWHRTREPVYGLLFVLPMVLFYELGVALINRQNAGVTHVDLRNGVDRLIRNAVAHFYAWAGEPAFVASGLVLVLVLLVWQIVSRKPWKVEPWTFLGMLGESLAYAVVLPLVAIKVLAPVVRFSVGDEAPVAAAAVDPTTTDVVMSFGAGVYEEFLFRLVLVIGLAFFVRGATSLNWGLSVAAGVVVSALAFAAAHHIGDSGEPFAGGPFLFRTFSGLFFGAIFYFRGFGIVAASHALYDVFYYLILENWGANG